MPNTKDARSEDEKQPSSQDVYLTTRQVCHLFEITKQGLSKWIQKGCPKADRDKYSLKSIFNWWKDHYIGDIAADTSIAQENLRYQRARAEREEITVLKLRESLIIKEQAMQTLAIIVAEARTAFLGLPRRLGDPLAAITDPKEIEYMLRGEITKILFDLAKPLKRKHAANRSRIQNRKSRSGNPASMEAA